MTPSSCKIVSYQRPGCLTPPQAKGLRAGAVVLKPGDMMDWHSTRQREELIVVVEGRIALELQSTARRRRTVSLLAGRCAFLPSRVLHRVVNRSKAPARYLYVTAPVT